MGRNESILQRFGIQLRALRKVRGWTQEQLGQRTGRHWTYIGGLERGERNPTLRVLGDLAEALSVSLEALVGTVRVESIGHPLENKLNATPRDVLDAIQSGFRTQVDVKGKLAELYLNRELERLRKAGRIDDVTWQDRDGQPDFAVVYRGEALRVECKNVRNEMYKSSPAYKVELQRTRNSMDGTPTRGYTASDFDVIAVCLFNQTGRWDYVYVAARYLDRREKMPDLLVVMQRVPLTVESPWTSDALHAFDDALGRTE